MSIIEKLKKLCRTRPQDMAGAYTQGMYALSIVPVLIELVEAYEKEFVHLSQEHKIVFSRGKEIFNIRAKLESLEVWDEYI